MISRSLICAAAVSILALCAPTIASAGVLTLANTNGGDGYAIGDFPQFKLFGSDNGTPGVGLPNITTYTGVVASPGDFTFHWSYETHDCCGSYWDPAGYVLNGAYTQLSTNSNPVLEIPGIFDTSGNTTVALNIGDVFGWYVQSVDSVEGRGELDVGFPSVPEPLTLSIFGFGLAGIGALRHRRKAV